MFMTTLHPISRSNSLCITPEVFLKNSLRIPQGELRISRVSSQRTRWQTLGALLSAVPRVPALQQQHQTAKVMSSSLPPGIYKIKAPGERGWRGKSFKAPIFIFYLFNLYFSVITFCLLFNGMQQFWNCVRNRLPTRLLGSFFICLGGVGRCSSAKSISESGVSKKNKKKQPPLQQ